MGLIRGCLTLIGLATLLLITSCVLGIAGLNRMANPTRFSRTVDEAPDKTRRMLAGFLDIAESEAATDRGLGDAPSKLAVQSYSDGSVRLTLDRRGEQMLQIVATFRPNEDGGTLVEVFSDAAPLAEALRPRVRPAALHREIQDEVAGALSAIDRHRVVPGGFLVSRMIASARGESRHRMSY